MALRLLTLSPYRKRLVSLAAAKVYLGISGSSQDSTITRLLATIANSFEQYLGFPLVRQSYEDAGAGSGRPIWILSVRPLDRSTLSVSIPETLYQAAVVLSLEEEDYLVEDARQSLLLRRCGWSSSERFRATFAGGYVVTEQLVDWSAALAVTAGGWVRPSAASGSPYLLEVKTSGTTAGAEPTWSAHELGDEITDGTAVFYLREAEELPANLAEAALLELRAYFGEDGSGASDRPDDLVLERDGPVELQYAQAGSSAALSNIQTRYARAVLESYR